MGSPGHCGDLKCLSCNAEAEHGSSLSAPLQAGAHVLVKATVTHVGDEICRVQFATVPGAYGPAAGYVLRSDILTEKEST